MARARRGRGEGSIFERSDGSWVGEVSLGYTAAGKRRRRTVYGDTKKGVQDELDRLRAEARTGALPDAARLTVGQVLDRWLAATKDKTSQRTHEERASVVAKHLAPHLGRAKLSGLTALHVEGLYADLRTSGVGSGAIRSAADVLATALRYAVRLRLIAASPEAGVGKPRVPKRDMIVLDEAQAKGVLVASGGKPVHPLLAAALGTGCRMGELLGLAWGDLDLRAGTLAVRRALSQTKTGFVLKEPKTAAGRRTVSLPPFAVDALTAHKAAALRAGLLDAPVFCTRDGGHLDRKNVLRAFRAVVKAANKVTGKGADAIKPIPEKVRFHDLRHTVASLLLSRRHSIKAVAKRLGHAKPEMTLRVYAHVMPQDDEHLADELGRLLG